MTRSSFHTAFLILAMLAGLVLAKDPPPATAPAAAKDSAAAKTVDNEAASDADEQARNPVRLPGTAASGETVLPNGWSLRPSGKQIKLGDFPVNIALHPKLPMAAILHAGYGEHEIVIVDYERYRIVSRVSLDEAFYGLVFDPAGMHIYASGAQHEVIHQFAFSQGYLSEHHQLPVGDVKEKLVPTGLAISADSKTLFACCGWGSLMCVMPLDAPDKQSRIAFAKDSYPYLPLLSKDEKRVYVSLWGKAGVAVVNRESKQIEATWPTDAHPTEMALSPDGALLYVACSNSNAVNVIDVLAGKTIETIASSLHPQAPPGSTPNSLALTSDGKSLFIANADNNNLAVFNVSARGKSVSLGFIPTGWYPTSVRMNSEGKILVANGKGVSSFPNPNGPNVLKPPPATTAQYIAGLMNGTLSVIVAPSPTQMAKYAKLAYQCTPLTSDLAPSSQPVDADNPIPARLGDKSPIKHCVYIVKENRTYDQVFGDIKRGNGDPHLCIFGESITPNLHALVDEFVLLDNFYVDSEVSADGHQWSMAAYANDFVEKTWPLNYRPGGKGKIVYPSEGGGGEIGFPAGGYIWDRCAAAGVSYRSYGEFVSTPKKIGDPGRAEVKGLEGHFDPLYRSWDLDYPDQKRADRFLEELANFEKKGEFPQFVVMRLPNDHTAGAKRGKGSPIAMVADNDLAVGRVVAGLSNSRFWPEMAIFVVEDDAQNGSDHVDAHRTEALCISPYCRRHRVDSTLYSTSSILRTMELVLNLKPMSQFDAAAAPMYRSFQAKLDKTPYKVRAAKVDIAARNQGTEWGAAVSELLDFTKEDAADDLVLNEIVWKTVRGAASAMPAPVRAPFVLPHPADDD